MVKLNELVDYCDDLLESHRFRDYCPNGLQIQGTEEVASIVSGVTACQGLIDAALEAEAQLVLVHHGYFWKGEDLRITGMKRTRIQSLLCANVSLLAYHLPLDAHPVYGNNAQLADRLGFRVEGPFGESDPAVGMYGTLSASMSAKQLALHIETELGRAPLHIPGDAASIRHIAWCTGAAQGYIEQAQALGVDAYLSGEISEQTVHVARETGLHYFSAGHHATERFGVMALGDHLAEHFAIKHTFVDINNPV